MAYETGTASSAGDLLVKLFDFAGANGWVIDDDIASDTKSPARGSIHKNNVYLTLAFTSSLIHIYPARGFTSAATAVGGHPESAHAATSTSTTTGVHADLTTGPYTAYYFFEDDNYIHIVVNIDGLHFRHFGFGESIKIGAWLGGEYYYGHKWRPTGDTLADAPQNDSNVGPFNGYGGTSTSPFGGMFIYGKQTGGAALPGATSTSSKWGYVNTYVSSSMGSDQDGAQWNRFFNFSNAKGGITGRILSTGVSSFNGYVPLVPMQYGLYDVTTVPDNIYFLGTYPDVRACNITSLTPGQEHVIDTDTWVVFPMTRKDLAGASDQWSDGYGLAYKKVVT